MTTTPTQASIDAAVYQITEWDAPRSRVNDTDYELYLAVECDRLKDKWVESWVQVHPVTGYVALFTWASGQLPVEGEDAK